MKDDDPLSLTLRSESDTDALGRALAAVIEPNQVIGLVGPLGAGKTRLTRSFAEALGVDPATIASPTFVLIHEYDGRLPIYHFDTFRLASPEDFDALGAAEYFSAGGVCVLEWADRVLDRLPSESWIIEITTTGQSSRQVVIKGPGIQSLRQSIAEQTEALFSENTE